MALTVVQIPVLNDNYIYLLKDNNLVIAVKNNMINRLGR